MNIVETVVAYLKAHPTFIAAAGTRIRPWPIPEGTTLPACSFLVVSAPRRRSQTSTMVRTRIQFSCWGETIDQATALQDAVIECLDLAKGAIGGVGSVDMIRSAVENASGMYEPETKRYHSPVDVIFWH